MVSNLVVEIAIYNFDLFHYTLLNNAAPDIAKICNCGAKGEIDCKAKAENSMVAKTNQPVDV